MHPRTENRKPEAKALRWLAPSFPAGAMIFLAGFFVYVWLRIEPALEYQAFGPYVLLRRSFFDPFLKRPGGLADYLGAFLAQLNLLNWLGALVFTALGALSFLTVCFCLERLSGQPRQTASLLPLFLLLLVRNRYGSPALAISAGFVLATTASVGYLGLCPRRHWACVIVSGLGTILLFYVAGVWSSAMFAVLAALFAIVRWKSWTSALCPVAAAVAGPVAAIWFWGIQPTALWNPWGENVEWGLTAALFLIVPLVASGLAFGGQNHGKAKPWEDKIMGGQNHASPEPPGKSDSVEKSKPFAQKIPWLQKAGFRRACALGLILAGCLFVWMRFNQQRKLLAEIDYYSNEHDYSHAVSAGKELTEISPAAEVRLHRALYHLGRLGDDLFEIPNWPGEAPLRGLDSGLEALRVQSRTLLELGLVNDAEHLGHEALEMDGVRPDILRTLARVNVLKNRPRAARIFLNVLGQIPFHQAEAKAALAALDSDARLSTDTSLALIRSRMPTTDLPHAGLPEEALLQHLLTANPHNKMAFEYLMTDYLLTLNLGKAVDSLWRLDSLGYAGIPRNYEEALLLYERLKGVKISLKGRQVRPETIERFQQFTEALKEKLYETPQGRLALQKDFGDTYWFYFYTARSRMASGSTKGGKT